jgi:hypothetical protein
MFATLGLTTLLIVPSVGMAEMEMMPPDDQFRPGIENDQTTHEEMENSETVQAEVVEINGNRLVAETEHGEQLVFLVEGQIDGLNVGDQLELRVDDQAKSAEILKVLPRQEQSTS